MCEAKRRRITAEVGSTPDYGRIRRTQQQYGEQRVFLRTGRIDIVDLTRLLATRVGPQDRTRNVHHRFY
jgi:hypothetical protein